MGYVVSQILLQIRRLSNFEAFLFIPTLWPEELKLFDQYKQVSKWRPEASHGIINKTATMPVRLVSYNAITLSCAHAAPFVKIPFMDQGGLTSEFSICLTLDHRTTLAVNAIREMLPASPYRDDTPHVTLLRTIKAPSPMSDTELLQDMERLLGLSRNLPLTATIHKPANRFSPLFRISSLVLLHPSLSMKSYRKKVIKILQTNNYSIGRFERLVFLPHISIRLGVPYTKQAKVTAEQSFTPKTKMALNKWVILRDIQIDGKYLVKQIALGK